MSGCSQRIAGKLPRLLIVICICFIELTINTTISNAQIVLEADATSNAYTVINNVLAPGAIAVETPDQTSGGSALGSHPTFGRHIQMVYDVELGKYVFQFLIHVNSVLDNDVSTGDLDRQRVEMKTYASSPANLKGTVGENITYKWRFRLPIGFQPSSNFTHIHQVKAVDGDDSSPLFTITPRYKSSGNVLELIYVKDSTTSNFYCASVPLSSFLGVWVEAIEQLTVGANGTYSMTIKRVSDGAILLTYSNSNIQTFRPSNSFIRPKWGIYRSITTSSLLRDDSLRIASVSITENTTLPVTIKLFTAKINGTTSVALNWQVTNEVNLEKYVVEHSSDGINFSQLNSVVPQQLSFYALVDNNTSAGANFYRLKLVNKDGSFTYSAIIKIDITYKLLLRLSPNPAQHTLQVAFQKPTSEQAVIQLVNNIGQVVKKTSVGNVSQGNFSISLDGLASGIYTVQLLNNGQQISSQKIIKQ